jgi:hypothetical protein
VESLVKAAVLNRIEKLPKKKKRIFLKDIESTIEARLTFIEQVSDKVLE